MIDGRPWWAIVGAALATPTKRDERQYPMEFRATRSRVLVGVAGLGVIAGLAIGAPGATPAVADTFDVTSAADSGPDSLRAAVELANANPGPDVVTIGAGLGEILLESPIEITGPLAIEGPGADALTIGRADTQEFHQFVVDTGEDVRFEGLTITGITGGSGRAISVTSVGAFELEDVAILDETYDVADPEETEDSAAGVFFADATGDITITDSTFRGNRATGAVAVYIPTLDWMNLTIENSEFTDNISTGHGAGVLHGDSIEVVRIADSTFTGNHGENWGPGVAYLGQIGRLEIEGSTFTDNHSAAYEGGAIYVDWVVDDGDDDLEDGAGDVVIVGSVFSGNSAAKWGGALSVYELEGRLHVADSRFEANTADRSAGAISIDYDRRGFLIERSAFVDNAVTGDDPDVPGGALAIYRVYTESAIVDSAFLGNHAAGDGGAIGLWDVDESIEIFRSTFAGNSAGPGRRGASIYGAEWVDVSPWIVNSTFVEDSAPLVIDGGRGWIYLDNSTVVAPGFAELSDHELAIYHSVVDSGDAPVATMPSGYFSIEWSVLTDTPTEDDFAAYDEYGVNHVGVTDVGLGELGDHGGETPTMVPLPGSLLIDAGDPDIEYLPDTDQRGGPRIVNEVIDVGAVEFVPAGPPDAGSSSWSVEPEGPLVADGVGEYAAVATVRDAADAPVPGVEVSFTVPDDVDPSAGTCTTAVDGTCSITLTSTVAGVFEVSAAIGDAPIGEPLELVFVPGAASVATSAITASPSSITAGSEEATITVTLLDAYGNELTESGGEVVISTTLGNISPTVDHGDGTYTATLTSDETGTAELSFTIDGDDAEQTATVDVVAAPSGLANSGVAPAGPILGALLLGIAGLGLVALRRREVRA